MLGDFCNAGNNLFEINPENISAREDITHNN